MKRIKQYLLSPVLSICCVTQTSCIKHIDLSEGHLKQDAPGYLYPFGKEVQGATAEITIRCNAPVCMPHPPAVEIPPLKYNKSWLFMLTQDDCKQAAYSTTWAAINGKPLSDNYFYNAGQLLWGDLPPDIRYLGKTLGSTDGAGNEIRFAPTTTLAPDQEKMNDKVSIILGYQENYYRFFVKSLLVWNNVRHMLNYGWGIAFHNVNIANEKSANMILQQLPVAQDSILKHLEGRGCKMLAEPDGNKAYVTAAKQYQPIQTMTAQAGSVKLYPFKVDGDLHHVLIERWFNDAPGYFKNIIRQETQKPKEERMAICVGVHGTDSHWVDLLEWINDTYGKDGDDSVWFPSQEEYYEYTYYRTHSDVQVGQPDGQTIKLTVHLPEGEYFYYPSLTVNLQGLRTTDIASVETDATVTGLSYADHGDGLMLNIDCRKYLAEHAAHFVEQYEKDKSNAPNKADALYFVGMLKDSEKKTELLNRIK